MTTRTTSKIFINYRRDDTRGESGRLMDTLTTYFGDGRIFRDIEGIEGGADFEEVISSTVGSAKALIVLIGPNWLTITDEKGQRRLDDPDDWVTLEIASALEKGLPVFPVLIEDTPLPRADDLPAPLKRLASLNAVSISDKRWDFDVTRLAKIVALDIPGSAVEKKLNLVRLATSLILLASVVLTVGIVASGSYPSDIPLLERNMPDDKSGLVLTVDSPPLAYWQSGITFVAILASSIVLLLSAPLMDKTRRRFAYAAVGLGLGGTFVFYVLLLPLNGLVAEPIMGFFASTVIAVAMLVLMNLSGFKPK